MERNYLVHVRILTTVAVNDIPKEAAMSRESSVAIN